MPAEPTQPDAPRVDRDTPGAVRARPAGATLPSLDSARQQRAFTLLELLVVIAIVAVLAGVAFPVLAGVRESGKSARCVGNLRQIFGGLGLYAQDHNNCLPQRNYGADATGQKIGYCEMILPYVDAGHTPANSDTAKKLFVCPSQKAAHYPADPGYGMNSFYDNVSLSNVSAASQTILLAETAGQDGFGSRNADRTNAPGSFGKLDDTRHRGRANYAFFDGHVESLAYSQTRQSPTGSDVDRWGSDAGIHNLPLPASPY